MGDGEAEVDADGEVDAESEPPDAGCGTCSADEELDSGNVNAVGANKVEEVPEEGTFSCPRCDLGEEPLDCCCCVVPELGVALVLLPGVSGSSSTTTAGEAAGGDGAVAATGPIK